MKTLKRGKNSSEKTREIKRLLSQGEELFFLIII